MTRGLQSLRFLEAKKVGEGSNKRLAIALGLALLGAAVSDLLLFQHHGETAAVSAVNEVCGDATTSGC